MALLKWSSKYSVGVAVLDEHRRKFLEILNELHAAMLKGQAQGVAGSVLQRLGELTSQAFSAEERLLENAKFPRLEQHREQHQRLRTRVEEFAVRQQKNDPTLSLPLLEFLRDWHTGHLLQQVREYIPYLAEKGTS